VCPRGAGLGRRRRRPRGGRCHGGRLHAVRQGGGATRGLPAARPGGLAYALRALFRALPGAPHAAALWWAALPLGGPLEGLATSAPMGAFLADGEALYRQRLQGVNADLGGGVLGAAPVYLRGGGGTALAPLAALATAVGTHSVRQLDTGALRLVLLAGLRERALLPPGDLLAALSGEEEEGGVATVIGGGLASAVGGAGSTVALMAALTGGDGAPRRAPPPSTLRLPGGLTATGRPGAAGGPVVGALLALASAWARAHNLRARSVAAAVALVDAWHAAVAVGLNLGGPTLQMVLTAGTLPGFVGLAPGVAPGRAPGLQDALGAAAVLPAPAHADAVVGATNALLDGALRRWGGADARLVAPPLAEPLAGVVTSLVWTLRGAGSLGGHVPALAPPPAAAGAALASGATHAAVMGAGASVGALLQSAQRSEHLTRALAAQLCAPGAPSSAGVALGGSDAAALVGGPPSSLTRSRLYSALAHLVAHATGQALPPVSRRTLALTAILSSSGAAAAAVLVTAATAATGGVQAGSRGGRSLPGFALGTGAALWSHARVPHSANDSDLAGALLAVSAPPGGAPLPATPADVLAAGSVDALGLEARGGWEGTCGPAPSLPGAVAAAGAASLAALGVLGVPSAPSLADHSAHTPVEAAPGAAEGGAYAPQLVLGLRREALAGAVDRASAGLGAALAAVGSAVVAQAAADAAGGPPLLRAAATQALAALFNHARSARVTAPGGPVAVAAPGWVSALLAAHSVRGLLGSLVAADAHEGALRSRLGAGSVASVQAMLAQATSAAQAVRAFVGAGGSIAALGRDVAAGAPLWSAQDEDEDEDGDLPAPPARLLGGALAWIRSATAGAGAPRALRQGCSAARACPTEARAPSRLRPWLPCTWARWGCWCSWRWRPAARRRCWATTSSRRCRGTAGLPTRPARAAARPLAGWPRPVPAQGAPPTAPPCWPWRRGTPQSWPSPPWRPQSRGARWRLTP